MIKSYQEMWRQGIAAIQQNSEVIDLNIGDVTDTRRGITLLARLPKAITSKVSVFLEEFSEVCPDQYYYPESDMHLTIMSIVSCRAGYLFEQNKAKQYLQILKANLAGQEKFCVNFSGISASTSGLVLTGFTNNLCLENIRNTTRNAIKNAGLENSMDSRYKIETAHSTVMRYTTPLVNNEQLIQFLKNNQLREFGEIQVHELELVFNDWYQTRSQTTKIGQISLV